MTMTHQEIDQTRHGFTFGLAGYSGAGKTTLAEKLIALLVGRGHRVASIKHAHHAFDPDIPGKDSWRHRKAGVHQMLIASAQRRVLFTETPNRIAGKPPGETSGGAEVSLADLLGEIAPADFVLVEGFKAAHFPKIEVWRGGLGADFLYHTHPGIKAVASDTPLNDCPIPVFDLNDAPALVAAIERKLIL